MTMLYIRKYQLGLHVHGEDTSSTNLYPLISNSPLIMLNLNQIEFVSDVNVGLMMLDLSPDREAKMLIKLKSLLDPGLITPGHFE